MPIPSLFEKELADDGRILSSLSWLRQSGFSTRVADERMVIYAANGTICAYCYSADEVVAFARRQSPVRGAGPAAPIAPDTPASVIRIRDLEETIRYLRERWHVTIAERDEWERRARVAERETETLRTAALAATAPGSTAAARDADAKYASLRRFLARELHPDASPATDPVRSAKSDLFKLVWAEIARLDKG
jgi:hypothetical protein